MAQPRHLPMASSFSSKRSLPKQHTAETSTWSSRPAGAKRLANLSHLDPISSASASFLQVTPMLFMGGDEEEFYDFTKAVTRHRLVSQDSYSEEKEEEVEAAEEGEVAEGGEAQQGDTIGRRAARERYLARVRRRVEFVQERPRLLVCIYCISLVVSVVGGVILATDISPAVVVVGVSSAAILLATLSATLLLGDTRAEFGEVREEDDDSKEPLKSFIGPEGIKSDKEISGDSCCACLLDTFGYLLRINHNAVRLLVLLASFLILVFAAEAASTPAPLPNSTLLSPSDSATAAVTWSILLAALAMVCSLLDMLVYCLRHEEIELVRSMRSTESAFDEITDTAEVISENPEMQVFADDSRAFLRAAEPAFFLLLYPISKHALLCAILLSDLSGALLLSRALVGVELETRDILVFVLMGMNATMWELLCGFSRLFESFSARQPMAQLSEPDFDKEEKLIMKSVGLLSRVQVLSTFQGLISGLLSIPLVVFLSLYASGQIEASSLLIVLSPFLAFGAAGILLESWSLCRCCLPLLRLSGCTLGYVRAWQMCPRVLATIWTIFLAVAEPLIEEINTEVPFLVYVVLAAYLLIQLCIRILSDFYRGRGLAKTIIDGKDNNTVDFSGRSLVASDLLCIGRYIGTTPAENEHLAVRLQDVYPKCFALTALLHGLARHKNAGGLFLDLSLNHIGVSGAKKVGIFLQRYASNRVRGLGLGGNSIRSDGAKALAAGIRKNKTLETLFLEYNEIGNDGVEAIAKALEENKTLKALFSVGNGIGDRGATALGNALESNEAVTVLGLDQNQIGPEGADSLVGSLAHNYTLRSLSLNENQIRAEGAVVFREGLKANKSLTELHLENNQLGDEGAIALGEGLRTNTTLLSLTLSKNKIGDEGAHGLGVGLRENQTLTDMNLNDNLIGPAGARHLSEVLAENQALRTLSLEMNRVTGNVRQLLSENVPRLKI